MVFDLTFYCATVHTLYCCEATRLRSRLISIAYVTSLGCLSQPHLRFVDVCMYVTAIASISSMTLEPLGLTETTKSSRQNQKAHGKTETLTAKPNNSRQKQKAHGKTGTTGESNLRDRYCETGTLGPTTPRHDTARGQNAFATRVKKRLLSPKAMN